MARIDYEHLSREQLIRVLAKRDSERKLGLVWERDEIEHDRAINSDFVALNLDEELSCGDRAYEHVLIEGDNFDALRYLAVAFSGQVQCIYIDPPYNTGKKDFIYNDRFVDEKDSWRYSKWLEFLYRRLLLARDLLSPDGAIVVSINDENRARLEMLMDEVFSGMRVGSFTWRTKDTGNDAGHRFSQVHEHILVYANPEFLFNGNPLDVSKYRNPDNDPDGPWRPGPITKAHSYKKRPNTYYPIQDPSTGYWYPCDPDSVWRFATRERVKPGQKLRAETVEDLIEAGQIVFPSTGPQDVMQWNTKAELVKAIRDGNGPVLPKKKTPLLREDLPDLEFWIGKPIAPGRPSKKIHLSKKQSLIAPIGSWIAGLNEDVQFDCDDLDEELLIMRSPRGGAGSDALQEILGNKDFDNPKPPALIKQLVGQVCKPDSIVMDFFAGSGTTAQAVLELNSEDNGERRFILVSSTEATQDEPEKNVCRDICARRIRRVVEGYNGAAGTGGSFAYFTTERIAMESIHLSVQHDQVWYALQLIHGAELVRFDANAVCQATESNGSTIVYLTEVSTAALDALNELIVGSSVPTVVYTWQPGLVRPAVNLRLVSVERIPEYLLQRFGGQHATA